MTGRNAVFGLVGAILLAGCSERPIVGESVSATDTSTSSGGLESAPSTSANPSSTSGATAATSEAATTSAATTWESAGDGCDELDLPPPDPDIQCGLREVRFDAGSSTLTPVAECLLTAVAPCFAEYVRDIYLEAHTSADEVPHEEASLYLADDRGQAVANYLAERGVPAEKMWIIVKGNLEASYPSDPADQKVLFIFQTL